MGSTWALHPIPHVTREQECRIVFSEEFVRQVWVRHGGLWYCPRSPPPCSRGFYCPCWKKKFRHHP